MAIKFNSAYRVCAILRAMSEKEKGTIVDQWASVFGIAEADRGLLSIAVARLVGLLREQVDVVETQLLAADFSDLSFTDQIAGARAIASVENLSGDWAELRAKLTPDVVHSFLIFSDALPIKETQLTKDEIDSFNRLYKHVVEEVDDGAVPRVAKKFLRQQLKIVANGVREYHVQGISAFQRAGMESAIQAVSRPAEVDNYLESEPVKGVTKLLKKIKLYGAMDMTTEQILTLSEEVTEHVGDPWPGWAWYERA
jgi:hypothetical protein